MGPPSPFGQNPNMNRFFLRLASLSCICYSNYMSDHGTHNNTMSSIRFNYWISVFVMHFFYFPFNPIYNSLTPRYDLPLVLSAPCTIGIFFSVTYSKWYVIDLNRHFVQPIAGMISDCMTGLRKECTRNPNKPRPLSKFS